MVDERLMYEYNWDKMLVLHLILDSWFPIEYIDPSLNYCYYHYKGSEAYRELYYWFPVGL